MLTSLCLFMTRYNYKSKEYIKKHDYEYDKSKYDSKYKKSSNIEKDKYDSKFKHKYDRTSYEKEPNTDKYKSKLHDSTKKY